MLVLLCSSLLWVCAGCSSSAPAVPSTTLSSDYVGRVQMEKDGGVAPAVLLLEQKGSEITGQYKLEAVYEEPVFGKVEGVAKKDEVELSLLIPPAYAIRQNLPNVVKLTLSSKPVEVAEAGRLLETFRAAPNTSSSGRTLLTGKAELVKGAESLQTEAAFLDAPAPGNPFNK